MPFPDDLLAWTANNKAKFRRYSQIAQIVCGLFLLLFGYAIGKQHLRLVLTGARAPGTVVDYQRQNFYDSQRSFSRTGLMPVVQFQSGDRVVRFTDWLGSSSSGDLRRPVTVLYDVTNPTIAMIDRPAMNWVPWGPTIAVGAFLILVGALGLARPLRSSGS